MTERLTVKGLAARLERLESEQAIRACMHRYMVLCDDLGEATPMDELAGLFAEDAVWEGVGDRYRATFGVLQGRRAIRAMLARYTVAPAHFRLNAHFLAGECIRLTGQDEGVGHWMMLQTSTFASGASHLTSARLTVDFRRRDGVWRMSHFRTENLFARPVAAWNAEEALPVPR